MHPLTSYLEEKKMKKEEEFLTVIGLKTPNQFCNQSEVR